MTQGKTVDFEVVRLPKLNHLFQMADTGAISEYGLIEETMSPLALETMGTWLKTRFIAPRAR